MAFICIKYASKQNVYFQQSVFEWLFGSKATDSNAEEEMLLHFKGISTYLYSTN